MSENEYEFELGGNGNKIFTVFDVDGLIYAYVFINSRLECSELAKLIRDTYNDSFGAKDYVECFEKTIRDYKGINKAEFIYTEMRFIQGEEYDK